MVGLLAGRVRRERGRSDGILLQQPGERLGSRGESMNSFDMMGVLFGISSLVMVVRMVGRWRAKRAAMRSSTGAPVPMPGLQLEAALHDEDRHERADRGVQLPPWRDAQGVIPMALYSMRVDEQEALPQLSVVAVDTPERQLLVGVGDAGGLGVDFWRDAAAALGPRPPTVSAQRDAVWMRWRLTDINHLDALDTLLDGLREAYRGREGA
jgi:hypothetical protein